MAYGSVLGQSQSVLSPATAIKMGLEPTASADDAFDKLTGSVLQKEMVVDEKITWEEKSTGVIDFRYFCQVGDKAIFATDSANLKNFGWTSDNFANINTMVLDYDIMGVFYLQDKFFAIDNHGTIYYSTDLVTWTKNTDNKLAKDYLSSGLNPNQISLVCDNTVYVARLTNGNFVQIYKSTDGLNWSYFCSVADGKMYDIYKLYAYENGLLVFGTLGNNRKSGYINYDKNTGAVINDEVIAPDGATAVYNNNLQQIIAFSTSSSNTVFIYDEKTGTETRKTLPYYFSVRSASEIFYVEGNYYLLNQNSNQVVSLNENLNEYKELGKFYALSFQSPLFFYDSTTNKFMNPVDSNRVQYGTLTPIIENQLTNIQGTPIQIPPNQILNGVRMATGSYVGTGQYGSSNPNILTFDFEPKLVFVQYIGSTTIIPLGIMFCQVEGQRNNGITFTYSRDTSQVRNLRVERKGNTVNWYTLEDNSNYGPEYQLNVQNEQYSYIAIG